MVPDDVDIAQDFIQNKAGYLQTQVGNPDGADKPNKKVVFSPFMVDMFHTDDTLPLQKYYDPRVWVREGEKTLSARVKEACADLGNVSKYHSHISPFLCCSLHDPR